MSKIEVDQVDPQSGTTLTLGTSGDTVSIPSGVTLANAGTATGFASIDWQSTVVTGATHTASANQGIWINTTSNACNLTLPGSPSVGDQLIFSDFARKWNINAVTLTLNGSKFQGFTSPAPVYNTEGETVHIVYSGSTQGWIPINDGAVAWETPQLTTTDFLVIAGGGGGGATVGGGGGAGGYRNSFGSEASGGGGSSETALELTPGTTYTITVGDGGACGSPHSNPGSDGNTSSITGSDITDITTVGGGGGGHNYPGGNPGRSGGSGGGGGGHSSAPAGNGGAGTSNQGYAGGNASSSGPQNCAGGGGGAGAVGGAGSGPTAGNGGTGLSSSITAAAVTRAGGGGGSGKDSGTPGSGGAGGGGNGGSASTPGTAGTANTGSGGGGSHDSSINGNGGKGVVILSMADDKYSGTTSGSPTVATNVGGTGKTVLTFNASGSYTA